MKATHILFSSLLFPALTFAAFCPTNFNQIQLGDTIEQVTKLCGRPTFQKEGKKSDDNVPQQWSYYIPQRNLTTPLSGNQGSAQTVISFDATGKVINIMINNVSVSTTGMCGSMISLGDDRERIKSACGTPTFINKQKEPTDGSITEEVKVIQFIYNSKPPATLTFENGKLTERK